MGRIPPPIPVTPAAVQPQNLLGFYAGFISRLLALLVDILLVSFTFVALTWFVSVTTTVLQLRSFLGFSFNAIPGSRAFIDAVFGPVGGSLLTGAYILIYYTFFWSLTGQTPGKALMGLRLVTSAGKRVSPFRALIRFFGYLLSGLPLGLGFLWVLLDDRRQGWHDKLAGTYVVYTWEARPDERFLAKEIDHLHAPTAASKLSPEGETSSMPPQP